MSRALSPDWWVTPEVLLLRDVEFRLHWLMWAKSEDGRLGLNHPRPLALTAAERAARDAEREYDAIPADEMVRWLGWSNTDEGRVSHAAGR